jgi:intracellular sulfur oxidation DsrE/DsrF family protein
MTTARSVLVLIVLALSVATTQAQQQPASRSGPVIQSGGEVYATPHIDFTTPLDMTYKVAFNMTRRGTSATSINDGFNTIARFLNMHAAAGVPASQMQLAVVVHGGAARDLLKNEAYKERTGEDNPNIAMVEELAKAGVRIIVCGQTAAASGFTKEMFVEPVEIALSAMTAFAVLQEQGYHVNPS